VYFLVFHAYTSINEMHGSRSKIPSKNLIRQRCAERFDSGAKGLNYILSHCLTPEQYVFREHTTPQQEYMNLVRRTEKEPAARRKTVHTHHFLETAAFGYKILKTFSNHANTYSNIINPTRQRSSLFIH
jgi:hypothetical protein